jgi:hypothetical protein
MMVVAAMEAATAAAKMRGTHMTAATITAAAGDMATRTIVDPARPKGAGHRVLL